MYGHSQHSGSSYGSSYSQQSSSYSSGIWQGANAVFPPLPSGPAPTPGAPGAGASQYTPNTMMSQVPQTKTTKPPNYNFKLRRSIQPRPPLTILNELAAPNKVTFEYLDVPLVERQRRAWQMNNDLEQVGEFECRATLDDLEFIAEGENKLEAKMSAAELAIQGIIAKKCEMNDWEGVGPAEDNCPWNVLASLALYRLYDDWQAQGYSLPKELTNLPGDAALNAAARGRQATPQAGGGGGVPDGEKPALQLVNELANKGKLSLEFELTGEVGTPNDKVFTMKLKVGERSYSGQAKTKKGAKAAAAALAMEDKDSWYVEPPPKEPKRGRYDRYDDYEEEYPEDNGAPGEDSGKMDEETPPPQQVDMEQDNKQPGSYPK